MMYCTLLHACILHFKLFCGNFSFGVIYALPRVNLFLFSCRMDGPIHTINSVLVIGLVMCSCGNVLPENLMT